MKPPRSDRPRTGAPAGAKPPHKPNRATGPAAGKPSYGKPSYAGSPDKPRGAQGRSSYTASSEKPNYGGGNPGGRPTSSRPVGPRPASPRPAPVRADVEAEPGERPVRTRRPASGFKSAPYTGPRPETSDRPERGERTIRQTRPNQASGDRPARPAARIQDRARESLTRERGEDNYTPPVTPRGVALPPQAAEAPRGTVWLYGQHAVQAALQNPARRLRRLMATEEAEVTLTGRLPKPWALTAEMVDRGRIDQLLGKDAVHQGIALLADLLPQPVLSTTLERPGPVLVLDQVNDPRNIGAILRSAAAFGVACVIVQERHAPEETGSLAKAASGALESVPLLRAVNLARTLVMLKAANFWVVGLDAEGPTALDGGAFVDRRVALVLGGEGSGLRRLTRDSCDELSKLPMAGIMESLNVSAATAVALYELGRKR
jgi:23S rRNA (guanosine2251-2'-O)-methyltransferase